MCAGLRPEACFYNLLKYLRKPHTMKLTELLTQNKPKIVDLWLQHVLESFPPETARFYKNIKDRFDNPMGYRLNQAMPALFEALLQGMARDDLMARLDEVISVKAIQNVSPSQALAFLFTLKNVVREVLARELAQADLAAELHEFDLTVDGMALLGFDVYTQRREKLCEIKVDEFKRRVGGLLRKSGVDLATLQL
jgi:hypothetical protein